MLRPVSADCIKQLFPPLRLLQIALAQTESQCFAAKLIHLFCQRALITAENFNKVCFWSHDLYVSFTVGKFMFHHGY